MNILFVHQNNPGQYRHIAAALAADPANSCVFLGVAERAKIPGVRSVRYELKRKPTPGVHHYVQPFEQGVIYGQAAARAALQVKEQGFKPDVICAHPGWGEGLFLKDVYPDAKLLAYCEFYYRSRGSDYAFVPENITLDGDLKNRARNATMLLSLEAADWGISPTRWQWQQHPAMLRERISVIHDGIDTDQCRPNPEARVTLPNGITLGPSDEVVTYVARELEPYRGFPTFMRAVAEITRRRPRTHVVVVGGEGVSYGNRPVDGRGWKDVMLDEVRFDASRVHFVDKLPYDQYLAVLQISSAHIYLTYPFVLSWSFMEAMATGCLLIGSATAPVQEVLEDGVTGLMTDFHDPKRVADRVDEAFAEPERMAGLRAAARAKAVAEYDLKTVCLPRQLQLIREVASGGRPTTGVLPA